MGLSCFPSVPAGQEGQPEELVALSLLFSLHSPMEKEDNSTKLDPQEVGKKDGKEDMVSF